MKKQQITTKDVEFQKNISYHDGFRDGIKFIINQLKEKS